MQIKNAEKYFSEEDPLGKTLTIIYGHVSKYYVVAGVAEDVPPNFSLQFERPALLNQIIPFFPIETLET